MSEQTKEHNVLSPIRRWGSGIYSHFGFLILMGMASVLSLVPALLLLYGFTNSGSLILLAATILAAGLFGIVWAAVSRTAWDLQFGFPIYLFKTFVKYIKENAKQGYVLGLIFSLFWALALSPLLLAETAPDLLTTGSYAASILLSAVLSVLTSYAFYQVGRWELTVGQILKNSVLFLLSAPLRALLTAALWLVLLAAALTVPVYVLPLSLFLGLPCILCVTTQSFYVPKIDELMAKAAEE